MVDIDNALSDSNSAYRQAIPSAISIHQILTDIEKTNGNSDISFDSFIFTKDDQTQFFLSYKSIFHRLFNPIAFEESDFNHGEDIDYLKQLINKAIIKTVNDLPAPKMTLTKIEHKQI